MHDSAERVYLNFIQNETELIQQPIVLTYRYVISLVFHVFMRFLYG